MSRNPQYQEDFYAWALNSAKLLRQGKFKEIDVEHIAEEMESMGGRDKRELINRFSVLIMHLLKWQFQPDRRCNSWKYTIKEQRIQIVDLLEESPSLKNELKEKFDHAYRKAIVSAVAETGISESSFPAECEYKLEDCLRDDFFPG